MKLNLRRLKNHPHESETFHLSEAGDSALFEGIGGRYLGPINVELLLENTGSMYVGKVNLNTALQLPCARCLGDLVYPVSLDFDISLAESCKMDNMDLDENLILFSGDEAEIGPRIEEAIFMAIPICPLCKPDCQGLCPICGQDKNIQSCKCKEDQIDPRWEKLNKLR